jgi:hypothetical protein
MQYTWNILIRFHWNKITGNKIESFIHRVLSLIVFGITLRLCQHNYFSDSLVVLMCFCMWRNTQQQTAGTRSNGEPRYCAVTPLEALRSLRRLEPSHFPTAGATQLRITQPVPDDWSYYPRHILLPDRRILHQLRFHCQQAVHGEFILSYVKTTSSRRWCMRETTLVLTNS